MSKICQLTGTKPLVGNHVSHSKRRTKRRFNPNLQTKRIFIADINVWIKLKLTTRALRNMEKIGEYKYLKQQIEAGFDPMVWVEDQKAMEKAKVAKRGYRRVETVDKNGNKSYSITFEPDLDNKTKVKLSSVIK